MAECRIHAAFRIIDLRLIGSGWLKAKNGVTAGRPEKIDLVRELPDNGRLAIAGRIGQLAYFGDKSHLYIDTDDGQRITCRQAHVSRDKANMFAIGDPCFAVFDPSDLLLLRN